MSKTLVKIAAALLAIGSLASGGSHATPDYWKCYHQSFGAWGSFGRLPVGCDVDPFGSPRYIRGEFPDLIFDDSSSRSSETRRYMQTLVPTLRDAARYYLHLRKPGASAREVEAWTRAVLAMAHQESFFSHYRLAYDRRVKMVRGDRGHGHGLMQIDDRWHYVEVGEGKGWKLFDNLLYALDLYYDGWQRAASAWCVAGSDDYYARSRSAYSVYNGGPSKVCRWKNSADRWSRNDRNYKQKLDRRAWEPYLGDGRSSYDAGCYMEGNEHCPRTGGGDGDSLSGDRIYKTPGGKFCLVDPSASDTLVCVEERRDLPCIAAMLGLAPRIEEALALGPQQMRKLRISTKDRSVCLSSVPGLHPVATIVAARKNINLRTTPGGRWIGTVPYDRKLQILDFEVRDPKTLKRYYLVGNGEQKGYIYAGDRYSYRYWTRSVDPGEGDRSAYPIPLAGDRIRITAPRGINLRDRIGGRRLTTIPRDTVVTVEDTTVRGRDNAVYYKVDYRYRSGYIYGGHLLPESTLEHWAKKAMDRPESSRGVSRLQERYWWTYLRSCPDRGCSVSGYVIGKALENYCEQWGGCEWKEDRFERLGSDRQGWSKIRLKRNGRTGWIESQLIAP